MTAAATRLTSYSSGGGCACKMPQSLLGEVLDMVRGAGPAAADARVLAGLDIPDDATVYALDDERAWVVTCDFITPVVDDAYDWGRIAAANALSDVYAMGARPVLALNLLGWPEELSRDTLAAVLRGGSDTVAAAGALIAGGHSIVDPVPKYGLVAIGEVAPSRMLANSGGRAGDVLVLTKPLGLGVIATAAKRGRAAAAVLDAAVSSATRLNDGAARAAAAAGVRAATDVTGYGLAGHLHEMAAASGLAATIWDDRVPALPGARELVDSGLAPDGSRRNLDHALRRGWFMPGALTPTRQELLMDAQTSGGLLLAVRPAEADALIAGVLEAGAECAAVVGKLTADGGAGRVRVEPCAA